jgi:hypothetical protein
LCDVPFGLSLLFPHRPSDGPARTKILGRTPSRHSQQLARLCNCIANVRTWLYSSKSVLHLHIRVQHTVVAQGTITHTTRAIAKEHGGGMNRRWNFLGTYHGLVIPTFMDLPDVEGEYVVKMRLDPAKASPAAYHAMLKLESFVNKSSKLEGSLLELIKMRASQINGCAPSPLICIPRTRV